MDDHFPEGARIAVLTREPIDRLLDYRAPAGGVRLGAWIEVPLGPRRVLGVVWGAGDGGFDAAKIRAVAAVLDLPPMTAELRRFLERAWDYTLTPPPAMLRVAGRGPALAAGPAERVAYRLGTGRPTRMTPARSRVLDVLGAGEALSAGEIAAEAGVSSGVLKGLVEAGAAVAVRVARDAPVPRRDPARPGRALSPAQAEAAGALRAAVAARRYGTTLLRGVTGSGKTEVYLEAVAECLAQGRQALVLLPEIALSAAFLERVEARFGARPLEWHSGVTEAARRRAWRAVADGRAQLVVGARSALFLPFTRLGLIVVDEEHDGSYKQEDGVLYHARDMAVLRASLCGAAVVLASATPSLESWVNAEAGRYARLDLTERFGTAQLPHMRAVDLKAAPPARGHWIAPPLAAEVSARLAAGEQALLFLNRRGYAPLTQCRACGEAVGCHQCDARMVEHRYRRRLVCHQCGAERPIPEVCPNPDCGKGPLLPLGPGVERLAEEAAATWPEARIAILSSDMAGSARSLREEIAAIAEGAADLVIGTQIVAKGHNFPKLTLVGVIDADLGLYGGDLRGAERTFQLVRQVAGRAGRAERPGLALIQTHLPEHPVIRAILSGEEEAFWQAEAAERRAAAAPPYTRYAGIIVSGPKEAEVLALGRALAQASAPLSAIGAELFGPAPAPIARIRGRHRVRLLVKAARRAPLQAAIAEWLGGVRPGTGQRIAVDIDPQSFF